MPNIADLHRLALSALLGEDVRPDHPSAFDHEPDDSQHWLSCIHWAEQRLREGKQSLDVVIHQRPRGQALGRQDFEARAGRGRTQ